MKASRSAGNKGFTLVEVVVVVVILVVIASMTLPAFTKYFSSKRSEKIKEEAKSVFQAAQVYFNGLYAENAHSENTSKYKDSLGTEYTYYNCAISGKNNNSVDTGNCYECDIHRNNAAYDIMKLAGISMNKDEPCSVIVGVGKYCKYADPMSSDYDPEKAYKVYMVIYQPVFQKKVYYYFDDENFYDKWPSIFPALSGNANADRSKMVIQDGETLVEIQLYYIKNGKDNLPNTKAKDIWDGQINKKYN